VINRRCSKSKIGAQASAAHWFVDATGPWSTQQEIDYEAMRRPWAIRNRNGGVTVHGFVFCQGLTYEWRKAKIQTEIVAHRIAVNAAKS
jgi:hypothetical protein